MPVTVLSISNLDEVLKVLKRNGFTTAKCDELGLSLGLLDPTLDAIRAENVDNTAGCLRACLSAWLRKVDNESKGDPTYYTLASALRSIGENAVADGIEREKCLSVYDGSGLNITKEAHAVNIFNRHQQWVRQLSHPSRVATVLQEEGIDISDDTLADIQSFTIPLEERTLYLIRDVRKAVEKDYTKLRVFARVCKNVSDKDTAESIMKDYGATFKAEATTEEKLEEEFRQTIMEFRNEIEAGNPSDVLLRNLKKFIDHRYSIKVNSASEAVSVIERKCTPFNITPLEEVTKELNCIKARQYVDDYKEAVKCLDPCQSQMTDSHLLKLEKLTIELECDHIVYQAEREELLHDLFGTLVTGVVKMHHSKDNIIICSFPSTCATLLMKIVLAKREECWRKGIKLITVGYCPMWNKEMCDEMYSAMDSKIKELSQKVKSCEDEIISLKKTLKDKNEESAHLEEKVERLEKENDSLTKNLAVMETTICDERSEKSDMELQLREVKEELENLKQLLKEGEEEKEALRMTETELREEIKTKSEMNRKMTHEIQQLKFSFSQTKGELEASLLMRKREIESLQEKLQSLKGKDQQQVLEIEQLQSSLQAKEDMTLSMEKSLQFLTKQVYVLKMEQEHAIEESVLMKENLQAELQEKDEALSLKQHQLQSFRVAKLELEKNLQQTKVEIDQLQRKITSLSVQLVHREQLVEKMVENGHYFEISGQQSPSATEKVSVSTSTDEATDDSTLQEETELTETSASFHSSSADKCQEVVIVESVMYVSLRNLFSDSAAILLNKLTPTGVRELRIQDTPLSQDSIQLLLSLLPQLRLLHFNDALLPATGLVRLIMAISGNTSLTNLGIQFSSPLLTVVASTSARHRAESLSHLLERNSTLTHLALSGLSLDGPGIHMLLAALAKNVTMELLTLDEHHRRDYQESRYRGYVKNRLDFR